MRVVPMIIVGGIFAAISAVGLLVCYWRYRNKWMLAFAVVFFLMTIEALILGK
jgi:hypothetical protein